jgi:multiple sugar transport system substrate-binding protein
MTQKLITRRQWLKGAAVIGLGTISAQILSACGGGAAPPAATEAPKEAAENTGDAPAATDVTLRVQVAGQPLNIMPLEFTQRFKEQTGVEVVVEETVYGEIETKTQTGFISNTLQDIVYGHHRWLFINYLKGIYLPLDDLFASNPPPDFEDIYPSILAGNQLDGVNFSLPETVHPGGKIAVNYNKAILAEKGLEEPTEGWTLDDWTELARAAADPDQGIFGLGLDNFTDLHYYSNISRSWGPPDSTDCWVMDKEGKTLTYNKPIHKEIAEWYVGLIQDRVVPRKADYIEDSASNIFIAGKSATHASIAGNVANFLNSIAGKFEMDAVVLPIGPDGRRGSCYSGNQYMVNSQTQHPEEAYELLKMLTSKEAGIYSVLESKLQPNGHKSAWTDAEVNKVNPVYGKLDVLLSAGVEPFPMPANTRFTETNDAFKNEIVLIWELETTWDEHVATITDKVQKILDLDRPS